MKKFYVVIRGIVPGIYTDWEECRKQIDGYSGALFKGFNNEKDAAKYYFGNNKSKNERIGSQR